MTTKAKPTYLSTADLATIRKLIDLAFSLAAELDRSPAERLGVLLYAIKAKLPDNPRALGDDGKAAELLESKDVRNLAAATVNRARKAQGKPSLNNMHTPAPAPERPTTGDVDWLAELLRAYLAGESVAVEAPIDDEPADDDAPPCRAFSELDSALLAAELDAWLAGDDEDGAV